jgi:tetratricopeptide (TPR) repeat protein
MEIQRPMYLSGRVMMEDGSAPPDSVVMELVCGGTPRPQGYTDSRGRFSFTLGQNQSMMGDASYGSASDNPFGGSANTRGSMPGPPGTRGYSERDLMGCELRAVLPGHIAEPVNLSGRRVLDNPDVGTMLMKRIANVSGFTFSATTAGASKDAKKAYEKGLEAVKKKKAAEAQTSFEKAVQLYPKYTIAWYELGKLYEGQQNLQGARRAYEEAINTDAAFVNPYMNMAGISARESKWEEVRDQTGKVLKLNPVDFPVAYFYNAVANYNLRDIDTAESSAREAVRLDTKHRIPKASHLLGIILAQKKDYPAALEHMKGYLMFAPNAADGDQVKKQIAEIERFMGTTSVVQTPQTQPPPK